MNENISLDYLESIQGKAVKVFKGGPESRVGQLLSVKSDYLMLNTEDEGVVIYQTGHIKSIIEDSTTSMNTSNDESVSTMMSSLEGTNSFSEVLTQMKGNMVRIDRGGPEARDGRLLDVKSDYLVLHTEKDGVVYYQLEHVKSLSQAVNNKNNNESNDSNQESNSNAPEYIEADNFTALLKDMRYKWVTINRGGPEKMQGVLADSSDGHLVLICEKEVCRLSTFHIRSISYVLKQESNQNAENNQNQEESNDNNQDQNENQNNENNNQKNENKNNNNSKKSFSIRMYSGSSKMRL